MWKLEERKEPLESDIESIAIIFVVKDKGWDAHITSGSEGKIVPLDVSEEFGVTRYPLEGLGELGVGPSGFHQFVGSVYIGTPLLETNFVVGMVGKPGCVADSRMAFLLQMESSHDVVKWRANYMNSLLHDIGVIANRLNPNPFC